MLELIIDGISSEDYGLCLMERPDIPTPERDVVQIPVRGHNGSLTRKYGYLDIDITVRLNLMTETLKADVMALKPWLLNGTKLQLSDDSVYYVINNVVMGDIENEIAEYGLFDVTFNCKPFACEDIPAVTLTASGTIYNPGTEKASPVLKLNQAGKVEYDINGRLFSVTHDGIITVDAEMGMVYAGSTPKDDSMAGEMPYLDPGANSITYGFVEGQGDMTSMTITYKAAYV